MLPLERIPNVLKSPQLLFGNHYLTTFFAPSLLPVNALLPHLSLLGRGDSEIACSVSAISAIMSFIGICGNE